MAEKSRPPASGSTGEIRTHVARGAKALRTRALTLPRVDGVVLAEIFLVAAVVTVLIIRAILSATGYPQLGGDGLHIAHVLWGGLLMLTGLFVLFLRLGAPSLRLGALLAGVGFGFFIDEIGKFVTSNVNYFFQPAVAMIYVVFVAIAIVLAVVRRRMRVDERTALANALALFDVAVNDPAAGDTRQQVLALLDMADPDEPLVPIMRERVRAVHEVADATPTRWQRMRMRIEGAYGRVAGSAWFPRVVVALFAVIALSTIALAVRIFVAPGDIGFTEWIQVVGSVVTAVLIALGLFALRRSRLHAYRWFERGILVDLLVTEVFAFYDFPGRALIGIAVDVVLLIAIRMASRHEVAMNESLSTPSLLRLGL
jgi:hypothetical protein